MPFSKAVGSAVFERCSAGYSQAADFWIARKIRINFHLNEIIYCYRIKTGFLLQTFSKAHAITAATSQLPGKGFAACI